MKSEMRDYPRVSVLYMITDNHWALLDIKTNAMIRILYYSGPRLLEGTRKIDQSDPLAKLNLEYDWGKRYWASITGREVVIGREPGIWRRKNRIESSVLDGSLTIERFRRTKKNDLINLILSAKAGLRESLDAIKDYIFAEDYTVHVYNHETQFLTFKLGSFRPKTEFMKLHHCPKEIRKLVGESEKFFNSPVSASHPNDSPSPEIRSLSRMVIEVPKKTTTAGYKIMLTFYSKFERYVLKPETMELVREAVLLKMTKEVSEHTDLYHELSIELTRNFSQCKLAEYLQQLAKLVSERLGWESCSVFVVDGQTAANLVLQATTDNEGVKLVGQLKYPTTLESSLTVQCFKRSRTRFSYDIAVDSANSHIFDESTESPPKNWIGAPIRDRDRAIGVLRVKNKRGTQGVVPFNPIDMHILEDVVGLAGLHVSALLDSNRRESEKDRQIAEKDTENRKIQEFIRMFRHEIRNPLIVFTQASTTFRRLFAAEGWCTTDQVPQRVDLKLQDISAIGDRLAYVAGVFTFEPSEIVREPRECSVGREIVFPVTNFAITYARKLEKFLDVSKSSFEFPTIFVDPYACSMAFHILVDNAIKYSDEGSTIRVYGRQQNEQCTVVVENYGPAISEDEKDLIFEKYYRGRNARNGLEDGSGIGLFLARSILDLTGARLELTSLSDPIRFEMQFDSGGAFDEDLVYRR